jgi:hypothetical protein
MHAAFVWTSLPHAEGGGGMVSAGIIRALLSAGHRVTICVLVQPDDIRIQHTPQLAELRAAGVEVVELLMAPRQARRLTGWRRLARRLQVLVRPQHTDFHPLAAEAGRVAAMLAGLGPDVVVLFQVVEALHGTVTAPRLALLGAMEHQTHLYGWRLRASWRRPVMTLVSGLRVLMAARVIRRSNLRMLSDYGRVGVLGAQDAVWLRQQGVTRAVYLPAAVEDTGRDVWLARVAGRAPRQPGKIIMVGHVKALPTLAGLYFFAREVLPRLEARLGADGFQVHIIGRYDVPPDLALLLARPSVRTRGFVEDIDTEFASADVLLVPTPIDFSIRVRICVAFSFGCCVVAHAANAPGMPELLHEHNVLMAGDGEGMAGEIARAVIDDALRERLQRNARRTYEEHYSVEAARLRAVGELERLVSDAAGLPAGAARSLARRAM